MDHVTPDPGPSPVKEQSRPAAGAGRQRRGSVLGLTVILVCLLCVGGFIGLMLRPKPDSGVRVWMLNHTPDEIAIINPFDGIVEKKFNVADGLRELKFSKDYRKAYVANVVDVTNKLTVLDTRTYIKEDIIEVDGVPQGIGVFPDEGKLAIITGSRTDFMAGGFDVIDLNRQSAADPQKKRKLYRERGLQLGHLIAVSEDNDRIYMVDAKSSELFIFSLSKEARTGTVNLFGAPEELLYPEYGKYYFVSVLAHQAIYQIRKDDDVMVGAYIYAIPDPTALFNFNRLRYCAVSNDGRYLYGSNFEGKSVATWEIDNPGNSVPWESIPIKEGDERAHVHPVPYFLPISKFRLTGGYNPNLAYTPGPKQVAVDYDNEYLFVVDEDGALYVYRMDDVMEVVNKAGEQIPKLEPLNLITDVPGDIRDLEVGRPVVRSGGS